MSIRFILGRAGSGKSQYCLDEIRQKLMDNPSGTPLILLVPEQATFQAEYALVTTPGLKGIIRAQVLSFRRLAFRVMQETGGTTRTPIDDIGKKMLLYKILNQRRDELRLFQHSVSQVGFIDGLNELFSEFKRYCITPLGFAEHLRNRGKEGTEQSSMLADKLHDLLMIYHDFEQEMAAQYLDAEDYLDILAKQMKDVAYLRDSEIWVDGFYGYTPQEFRVIEQLLACCRSVNMSLCLDRVYGATESPHELDLFYPTAVTMIRIQELADKLGVAKREPLILNHEILPRFVSSPMIAHLEKGYEKRIVQTKIDSKLNISIHAAVHRRAEIEGTARELIRLVRDCGYRYRDMAVMVRNMDDYQDFLITVFDDYNIPYFFDQKHTVMHHPLVEFIRSAIEVVQFNWRYDSVFRCVKTDFLLPLDKNESQVNRQSMDELENYVLSFGLQGTRWTGSKPWEYKRIRSLEDEAGGISEKDTEFLIRMNESRMQIVRPLTAFQKKLQDAVNARDQIEALYELLDSVHASERLERWSTQEADQGNPAKSREHIQVWGKLIDMFDQIVEVIGNENISLELFSGMLETGLENMKLGIVPPSLDQVLVGSIDRTRSNQIKHSFILGVNDGVIPSKMNEDGILSEQEREHLTDSGLELAPGSRRKLLDEQFLIYTALTTPSEHLWLFYSLADDEGKSLLPSEVIRRIRSMFPEIEPKFLMAEPLTIHNQQTQLEYIVHPHKALSYLVVQLRHWKRGMEIDPIWWDMYNWFCSQDKWRIKLSSMIFGLFFRNEEKALTAATSQQLYGKHLKASVSRMEKYAACPFAQFISHGLRLQNRLIYRLDAPDIGQLFHAALSRIAIYLQQDDRNWGELTAIECEELANEAVEQLSPRLQGEILLSSKRYFYIAHKLKKIIGRATIVLGEHARRGAFHPVGLELDFGTNQTLPPLLFSLDNGCSMEIIGRIDRVDRAESEQGMMLRVIDYKSSQTNLDLAEVYYGVSLQVLTYLDVVITHSEQWLKQHAKAAGALYFHVHNPVLQKKNNVSDEEAEEAIFKLFKMKGLVLAEPEVIEQMDNGFEKGHSELIPVSIKADGSYYKHSSVATERQWHHLRNYVRQTIRRIGTGITNGNVEIKPYRMGQKIPCTYCSYQPICQFDQLYDGNEYNHLKKHAKSEVWELIGKAVNDNYDTKTDK